MKDLEKLQKQLAKEIKDEELKLKAWKEVSFPTKKDGTPYKVFSKNIKGATLYQTEWGMQGQRELSVYTYGDTERSRYSISDSIRCWSYVCDLDDTKKDKTENYQPKVSYLKQVYTYDLDDTKQAVANRIEQLEKNIESMKAELKICEVAYNEYKNAMEIAQKQMEIARKQLADTVIINNDKTLYYMIYE